MKFWQKIYLFSILTFVVVFNIASVMVIERNHNKMLQQEINNVLSENMSIYTSVGEVIPIMKVYDSIDYEQTVLTNIAKRFVNKNWDQNAYLQITEGNRSVFSNLNFTMPQDRKELHPLNAHEIRYILRDIGNRTLLFTSNLASINGKHYVFTYVKDVTALYDERMDQYLFFVKADIGAVMLYALVMFLISKGLTKPIDRMIRTAKVIAEGRFSERVELKTRDEIGMLGANFNEMAKVVEDKINQLERNNHEKERFIQNITHELKTPLTSIIGYANFLRTTKVEEKQLLDGLDVIYSEAKRLESLSVKLMDLILFRQGHAELKIVQMLEVIREAESSLQMKAAERRLRLDLRCVEGEVRMDPDLVKVLIYNLVDNAMKASGEAGIITIQSFRGRGSYTLEVHDHGIGIPEEHLPSLFEPFYMVDKARTKSQHGAGLGLSICQSIAEMHGARMEVESTPGEGTTIRTVFPFQDDTGGERE